MQPPGHRAGRAARPGRTSAMHEEVEGIRCAAQCRDSCADEGENRGRDRPHDSLFTAFLSSLHFADE